MKQFISITLIVIMVMGFSSVVLAEGVTQTSDVSIIGTVESVNDIDVDVPVSLNFTIKEDRSIEWASAEIVSRASQPLTVTMVSTQPAVLTPEEIAAGYVQAPALVADNAFTDWDNLTVEQTKSNIAISINGKNLSVPNQVLGTLDAGTPEASTLPLVGSALYGKAWPNTAGQSFKYNMVLEIGPAE
ncbi:hypothetical protein [Mahella australiensis]|uniref:WxL domain-containing protein n=1 Tax=Mahella australiensis (strain DSM 15567 / CIP 107919 / 50-1 BON) TaxID=697281 RepID=F3ZWV7_MAHA5|nr:hypothetical protein [Mahella australiensis]AEE97579.1 hypothetical protein Mahau_2416 [Mahella australiensis 50-1 BON]